MRIRRCNSAVSNLAVMAGSFSQSLPLKIGGMMFRLSASAAAILSRPLPEPPSISGGWGFCTGRGLLYALRMEKYVP